MGWINWVLFLVCSFICPVVMLVSGLIFWKRPPKTINSLYGYRSDHAMKSQAAWDFAQRYSGKIWRWLGLILLILSAAVVAVTVLTAGNAAIGVVLPPMMGVQVAVLLVPIYPVERALKRNFDEDGKPVQQD